MGSVSIGFGGPVKVSYFTDDRPESNEIRLAAVAVWRNPGVSRARGSLGFLGRLREKLGPRGLGLHFRWNVPDWNSTSGEHGEQETRYSPHRGVVRVLGKKYAVPTDGGTLVLLIDEGGSTGAKPIVTVRTVLAPRVPSRPIDRSLDPESVGRQRADAHEEEMKTWTAALQSDPEVRAFMGE
jgi:hypothetical protein